MSTCHHCGHTIHNESYSGEFCTIDCAIAYTRARPTMLVAVSMTPLEIACEMVALADHQREQRGSADSEADRVARELLVMHAVLRAACRCNEPDVSPPIDWETRVRIPHHCDCPMYVVELPDAVAAPAARTYAMEMRAGLLTWR